MMNSGKAPRAKFNGARVAGDMAVRGWNQTDLARVAGVNPMTITRFLRGDVQSPRTAAKIAQALGYSVRRYFLGVQAA